jgi:signal transduction histidine kinase/ActR/RegA family two-component response regulator
MKPLQSIEHRLQLVIGLCVTILVAVCAMLAVRAFERSQQAGRVMAVAQTTRDLFAVMNTLRLDRGANDIALASPEPAGGDELVYLASRRDQSIRQLGPALAELAALEPGGDPYGVGAIRRRGATVEALRREIYAAMREPSDRRSADLDARWLAADGGLIDALGEAGARLSLEVSGHDPFTAAMMNIGRLAWSVRDAVGSDMMLVGRATKTGRPLSAQQRLDFEAANTGVDARWTLLVTYARLEGAPTPIEAAIARANHVYFGQDRPLRQASLAALSAAKSAPAAATDGRQVYDDVRGLASLMGVATAAFDVAAAQAAQKAAVAEREFYAAIAVMILAIGLGISATLLASAAVLRPIQRIAGAMRAVADGDLAHPIPDLHRQDEVGDLARALGVFRDNALAKQRMDDELVRSRVAREAAEAASAAKAQFMANMSHEIRTPLTGVIGFAGLLARIDELPDKARAYVSRIVAGGQALLALVNDILDFSRIEAGQVDLGPQPFALGAFVEETVDLVRPAARNKRLELHTDYQGGLPATVRADRERLRQVLLNLLGNAVKFTNQGGVTVTVARAGDARLKFTVTDTGEGIAPNQADRLFQRFSQVDESNTRRHGGAGLGLAISKGLVELMGGQIGFESQAGRGSSFWFTLPAPPVETAAGVAEAAPDPAPRLAGRSVLLVDDVAANREVVIELLSPLGLRLAEAANGAEAVAAAQRRRFDLILMDLQMPVMDGLAATRAIRGGASLNAATPIVALSANVLPGQVEACHGVGMNDHIAKPIDQSELLWKIDRWIATAQPAGGEVAPSTAL